MRYTNNYGIPNAIYRAITSDPYDAGDADISVTGLIGPPQIARLRKQHDHELEVDVSDMLWSLLGRAVHDTVHGHGDGIEEERLYAEWNGLKISGQSDHIFDDDGVLTIEDYKVTSVWSAIYGIKPEWEAQLNLYRWLWRENGFDGVGRLRNNLILRDWVKPKSHGADYPDIPFATFDIPVWPDDRLHAYLDVRTTLHKAEGQVLCTNEERWYSGDKWAVVKAGAKKSYRNLDTRAEAEAMAASKPGYIVEHRPGGYKRCQDYCDVAAFCPQFNGGV